jgi:hypothetical protein
VSSCDKDNHIVFLFSTNVLIDTEPHTVVRCLLARLPAQRLYLKRGS